MYLRPVLFVERILLVILLVAGVYVATMDAMDLASISVSDKIQHFFVFFCFAILLEWSVKGQFNDIWKFLLLLSYGLFIECAQYFTPNRFFEWSDLLADGAGLLLLFLLKQFFVKYLCPNTFAHM